MTTCILEYNTEYAFWPNFFSVGCCKCFCPDTEKIHFSESLGPSSQSRTTEHVTNQPDVDRSQQSGFCQRPGIKCDLLTITVLPFTCNPKIEKQFITLKKQLDNRMLFALLTLMHSWNLKLLNSRNVMLFLLIKSELFISH